MERDCPGDLGEFSAAHALASCPRCPCRMLRLRRRALVSRNESQFSRQGPMSDKPNKPDAVNPAMAVWFAIEDQLRRVTDLERWATLPRCYYTAYSVWCA